MNETPQRVRRLACYGWVAEHAGSVASAGYVVLAELLRRGVEVHLFAHRDHVPEPPGLRSDNFVYRGFDQPRWLDLVDGLPGRATEAARRALFPLVAASWQRVFGPAALEEHRRSPYDAVLALHTTPVFAVPGAPVVTWLQGPYHTELEAFRRLRPQVIDAAGLPFYAGVASWYRYYAWALRHNVVASDRLIVPSEWARREMLEREGTDPPIEVLPYPVDLEAFRPEPAAEPDPERPVILSLGRLDPRKRLDLLLDAFGRVRESVPGARLLVVGAPGNVPGALAPLKGFAHDDAVEYRPQIPRERIPALLREATLLVQTSEHENFGSSVAEALSCGTTVVVGPSNGTADYVDASSRIFERYTPDAVARAVVDALAVRRSRPAEAGARARAAAERWFAAPKVADRLVAILGNAIAERSPPS